MRPITLLIGLLLGVVSCRNTIIPPPSLADPVAVYVVDHGRHASLIVPAADRGFVHYSFGAWRWYALGDESLSSGAAAIFGTAATLGRRELYVGADAAALKQAMVEGAESVLAVPVAAAKVANLRHRLDRIFWEHQTSKVVNAVYGLDFVQTSEIYSLVNNSNVHVAQWLEELGCTVSGPRIYSSWQLQEVN